ncbi:MAG: hypothetical protein ACYC25_06910 [Paludibacter sp.]
MTIIILTFIQQFLKTDFNLFYKSRRDEVRKYYNIPSTDKLWFNGFDYKPIIFINDDGCLEKIEIPIQRMVWIKGLVECVHICLYPSFIIKRCPFPTSTLEYIWENCVIPGIEPFDLIKDPNSLLDSSIPLEYYTKKIFILLGTPKYMTKWNYLYYKTFHTLPLITEKELLEPNVLPSKYAYLLIRLFVKGIKMNISEHEYLSFANFQIPLK